MNEVRRAQERDPLHRRAPHAGRRRRRRRRPSTPRNVLKPALARGEIQCIGATTLDEYRKYIEKDCGPRAPLPDRSWSSRRASRRGDARSSRACATATRAHHRVQHHRRRPRGRRRTLQPLHHRPLPAGQGHRRDRRSRGPRPAQGHDAAAGSRRRSTRKLERLDKEKEEAVADQDFEKAAALRDQADKLEKKKQTMTARLARQEPRGRWRGR